jgi:hypothetical protein
LRAVAVLQLRLRIIFTRATVTASGRSLEVDTGSDAALLRLVSDSELDGEDWRSRGTAIVAPLSFNRRLGIQPGGPLQRISRTPRLPPPLVRGAQVLYALYAERSSGKTSSIVANLSILTGGRAEVETTLAGLARHLESHLRYWLRGVTVTARGGGLAFDTGSDDVALRLVSDSELRDAAWRAANWPAVGFDVEAPRSYNRSLGVPSGSTPARSFTLAPPASAARSLLRRRAAWLASAGEVVSQASTSLRLRVVTVASQVLSIRIAAPRNDYAFVNTVAPQRHAVRLARRGAELEVELATPLGGVYHVEVRIKSLANRK